MFFSRLLRMSSLMVLFTLTSGCAWYESLKPVTDERDQLMTTHNPGQASPEMARFYELQMRIDALEAQLKRESADPLPVPANDKINESKVESLLRYVREQTRAAIELIDNLLAKMDPPADAAPVAPSSVTSEPENQFSSPAPQSVPVAETAGVMSPPESVHTEAAIAGTLQRGVDGQVVASTSDGNRYNYSVVYVYPETRPWFDMWALLDKNGVQDKWRGQNPDKQTYFIYVGAYYTERPARKRSMDLQLLTGDLPEIRVREGYQAVALK